MIYDSLANDTSIEKTIAALKAHKYNAVVVENGKEALKKIKELIPKGVSVMNGSSVTLEQIGFVEYLKTDEHSWNNLHKGIVAEKDPVKQQALRKQAELSDYYLGSVHALTESGEYIVASNTGSQLPHIVFTSPNLIFVVSSKKIVPTFEDGMKRLKSHVVPQENKRMMAKYGVGTNLSKILITNSESASSKRQIVFLLIKENLGF